MSYKERWLYFTVVHSEYDGGYYVEIFDRQGNDVATLPKGDGVYPTKAKANTEAVAFIQKKEAQGREIESPAS
jgi:hypothetical protein